MTRKTRNPGAGRRQGFDIEMVSQAGLNAENSLNTRSSQSLAVSRLVARYALSPSLARAVSEANAWGRA